MNRDQPQAPDTPQLQRPTRTPRHPGRNHACPCGSGKKFKRCCWTSSPLNGLQKVTNLDDEMQALAIAGGIVQRMMADRDTSSSPTEDASAPSPAPP